MAKNKTVTKKETLGQKVQKMHDMLYNTQVAMQMMQNMLLKINNGHTGLDTELGTVKGMLQELDYRTRALIYYEGSSVDLTKLDAKASEFKLKDFDEGSEKEDIEQNLIQGTLVEEDSTVIWTSTVKDQVDAGVFRSRVNLKETHSELQKNLVGLRVGDSIDIELNGFIHQVEVLGIRVKSEE